MSKKAIAIGLGVVLAVLVVADLLPSPERHPAAAAQSTGTDSGLPVPRFVSLKADKVNVRRGPSTDQAIVWVFSRAGLPVEIIAESDNWRRVRDSEGADGWVFHSLLSGRRTALVSPWAKKDGKAVPLYDGRSTSSSVVAELQPGVLGDIDNCDGEWCEIAVGSYTGYVRQELLWGAYRGEVVN